MARSTDINQRIVLTGADEVRKGLDQIAAAGQRSGNLTRQALLAALGPTSDFTAGINAASEAHRGLSAQGQAVFHSMRSVTEQLALGVPPATALTQQLNHLSFAATGPGGISGAFGELAAGLRAFITPTTAAVAGFAALAAGFALLISRAASAENGARQFDVILKGMGDRSGITGKQLEEAAHNLRDVGLSTSEALQQMESARRQGVRSQDLERVVRIGANLNAVLGEGSMEKFISAAAQGGPALEAFAKQLNIVGGLSEAVQKQLDSAAASTRKFNNDVSDIFRGQARSLADVERDKNRRLEDLYRQRKQADTDAAIQQARSVEDLTREKGTALQELQRDAYRREEDLQRQRRSQEEQIEIESKRRIEDINVQAARRFADLAEQRNKERADELAAFNKQIEDEAQKALDTGQGLLDQIEQAVSGSNSRALSPFQESIRSLNKSWNDMLDTLAKSDTITALVTNLDSLIKGLKDTVTWADTLSAAIKNIPGLPPWLSNKLGFLPFTGIAGSAALQAAGLFAEGGLVRGPGGPTGDMIHARLSDNEFVSRARAVQVIGADVYAALNAFPERFANLRHVITGVRRFADGGLASIADRVNEAIAVPRFATGGLVTVSASSGGGAGRSAFTIVLDGKAHRVTADRAIADSLHRTARQQQIVSAGRKPGYRS